MTAIEKFAPLLGRILIALLFIRMAAQPIWSCR